MTITYRTTDLGQWGTGLGSNLTAAQIDENFWTLYNLIQSSSATTGVGVASASVNDSQLSFTLTDGTILGPFTLPTISLNPRGLFALSTTYAVNDVFTAAGCVYIVIYPHTSSDTLFDQYANDGAGHNYYQLLFAIPGNTIPAYGSTNDVLLKLSDSNWDIAWGQLGLTNMWDVSVTKSVDINGHYLKWNNDDSVFDVGKPTEIPTTYSLVSGAITIDRKNGEIVSLNLSNDITGMTVTNWPASGIFGRLVLEINNAGNYAITSWPTGTVWPGGVAPTLSNGIDIIILMTLNGGSTIYGSVAGKNFS